MHITWPQLRIAWRKKCMEELVFIVYSIYKLTKLNHFLCGEVLLITESAALKPYLGFGTCFWQPARA